MKSTLFVKRDCILVRIYGQKTTSASIHTRKHYLNLQKYHSSDIHPLVLLRHSKTPDFNRRIISSPFPIGNSSVQPVPMRFLIKIKNNLII